MESTRIGQTQQAAEFGKFIQRGPAGLGKHFFGDVHILQPEAFISLGKWRQVNIPFHSCRLLQSKSVQSMTDVL